MSSLKALQDLIQQKTGLDATALNPPASTDASNVDSLALVEWLFDLEHRHGISITGDNTHLDSLAEMAKTVDQLRAAPTAAAKQ